jgi:phosphatidylglycerol---prolipoprotein diacylglyceryl transferase
MHPIIFQTSYFTLNTFWVFFAIALVVCLYMLVQLVNKHNLKMQFLSTHFFVLVLVTIVGARVSGIIENFEYYFTDFNQEKILGLFAIWDKNLNFWGAIGMFLLYFYFLCKRDKQDFFKWLDILVPVIITGIGIGSLGAFFDGINYGNETNMPWGVNFESPIVKYAVPIHPTQIYALLYCTILVIGLFLLPRIKKIKDINLPGTIGLLGVSAYSFFQFIEEFFRGDDALTIFDIRISQIASLIVAILTGIFLYLRYNRHTKIIIPNS